MTLWKYNLLITTFAALAATSTAVRADSPARQNIPDIQGIRPGMSVSELKAKLSDLSLKLHTEGHYFNIRTGITDKGITLYIHAEDKARFNIYEIRFSQPLSSNILTSVVRTVKYDERSGESAPLSAVLREALVKKFGAYTADVLKENKHQQLIWIWDRNGKLLDKVPGPMCEKLHWDYIRSKYGTKSRQELLKSIDSGCGVWMQAILVVRPSGVVESMIHMIVDFVGIDHADRQVEQVENAARAKQSEAEVKRARQQKPSI